MAEEQRGESSGGLSEPWKSSFDAENVPDGRNRDAFPVLPPMQSEAFSAGEAAETETQTETEGSGG